MQDLKTISAKFLLQHLPADVIDFINSVENKELKKYFEEIENLKCLCTYDRCKNCLKLFCLSHGRKIFYCLYCDIVLCKTCNEIEKCFNDQKNCCNQNYCISKSKSESESESESDSYEICLFLKK